MIIKKLPHWVLSSKSPSFYETEGGTVLEQTAIMYKKMQELIDNYNSFVDEINNEIDEFISSSQRDQEEFELKINQMIHDFTTLVTTEMNSQVGRIDEFIESMSENLRTTVQQFLVDLFESGRLSINFEYNAETEQLDITGLTVAEGGIQ
jgi:polyhydroxyalkanoate synthesis regulator phasin